MNYSLSEERSPSAVFAEGDGAFSYEFFVYEQHPRRCLGAVYSGG